MKRQSYEGSPGGRRSPRSPVLNRQRRGQAQLPLGFEGPVGLSQQLAGEEDEVGVAVRDGGWKADQLPASGTLVTR